MRIVWCFLPIATSRVVNNTFTDNGTAVCIDSLPGNEVIDFAGSVFSGNDADIENKADHAVDTAKATFE